MRLNRFQKFPAVLFAALLLGGGVVAQEIGEQSKSTDRDQKINRSQNPVYVISARAGGVSLVSGTVRVRRAALAKTEILAKSDELNDRDQVATAENGKAEILLNPGSFLRLAENTDLEFTDTALESLRLKLNRGSALLEASTVGDEGADISVSTPNAKIRLEKSGIYRINAGEQQTEVLVWKGAATVGADLIKAGRKIVIFGGNATVAKFDKHESRDAFDIWSKDRAKELAKLNDRLERRTLANAFTGFNSEFNSSNNGFRSFGSSGYWVLNRLTGAYCFVPFGNNYWGSPYGYGYNRGIWWGENYRRPVVVAPQQPQQPPPNRKAEGIEPPTVRFPGGRVPSTSPSQSSDAPPTTRELPRMPAPSGRGKIIDHQ